MAFASAQDTCRPADRASAPADRRSIRRFLGFVSYEFFSTTERYEVDFTIPLLLVALTIWLVLSTQVGLRGRRFVRMAGALQACVELRYGLGSQLRRL